MASNKRGARVDKLTRPQEIFAQEIVKGKSQREAYIIAYPEKKKWKENSIDSCASSLFKNPKVRQRYEEILKDMREREQETTRWTREQSIETLRYVIDMNKRDLERIEKAAEEELEWLQTLLAENPDRAREFLSQVIRSKKTRRASQVNNRGITDAVAELNKMQGFNEETINLNGSVVFEGEKDLED